MRATLCLGERELIEVFEKMRIGIRLYLHFSQELNLFEFNNYSERIARHIFSKSHQHRLLWIMIVRQSVTVSLLFVVQKGANCKHVNNE